MNTPTGRTHTSPACFFWFISEFPGTETLSTPEHGAANTNGNLRETPGVAAQCDSEQDQKVGLRGFEPPRGLPPLEPEGAAQHFFNAASVC